MSIVSTGLIKLSDIQTEFGGTNPIFISEYYNNGSSGFVSNITGIPSSGFITVNNFKGKAKSSIPIIGSITARYSSEGPFTFSGTTITQWNDLSGNNRHITTYRGTPQIQTFTRGTKGLSGTGTFNVVYGDENSGFAIPFALTQGQYTFCYIARYVGDRNNQTWNNRIFDARTGTGENCIWGFHGNVAGRSHNGQLGWYTTTEFKQSDPDYWLIGIDTESTARYNGLDCTNYYTFNNVNYPQRPSAGFNPTVSINFGRYTGQTDTGERSRWQILELIFYNKELSISEKIEVENYLALKYGHISFSNVVSSFNNYKNLGITLVGSYDRWYHIYNGIKIGYGNSKWFGPGKAGYEFYNVNNFYYFVYNYQNWNVVSPSGYNNRNTNRIILNNFTLPSSITIQYRVSIIVNGGGGGGGQSYGGGGGGGGQAYISNNTSLLFTSFTVYVGGRGWSGGLWDGNVNTSGGDTELYWNNNTNYIIGNGGVEGVDSNQYGIAAGGGFSNVGGSGGGNGGNSIAWNYWGGGALGGAIPTVTTGIIMTNSSNSLWNVINLSIGVYSYNSGYWWGNSWGAGGQGSRGGTSGDYYARNGGEGGPGFFIVVIDSN